MTATPLARSDDPILRVRGLSKTFQQGGLFSRRAVRALHDVSFDVGRGEIVALVGESGSGKSTIARILARLEHASSGTFLLDGVDIVAGESRRASRSYRSSVQMVFQDPFGSLNPNHRIEHFLTRPLLIHDKARPGRDLRNRLRELMETVGLTEDMLESYPHQLSGGQRQRVAIARALAVEPKVILADEPTSMLDVSVRIGILNLMRRLCDERGISILYITHDLASARYVADRTLVLFAGEAVEGGESIDVMANPRHPYTRLLVSAVPDPTRRSVLRPDERAELRAAVQVSMYGPRGTAAAPAPGTAVTYQDSGDGHWVRSRVRTEDDDSLTRHR